MAKYAKSIIKFAIPIVVGVGSFFGFYQLAVFINPNFKDDYVVMSSAVVASTFIIGAFKILHRFENDK
jgi:hypothetical protein